jgi:hypothetical protein
LKSLHERYADRGLRIVAVNAWDEPSTMVADFARKQELPYVILLNGSEVYKRPYKGKYVPMSYVLDHEGVIRYVHSGWDDGDEAKLAAEIEKLLNVAAK